ncbi:MAG: PAC2 family protein [Nanoarchaeota archaeon]|nr:PAC2 family protein [Nanoarchaeota archaeon]MBU4242538.1 PAC2 family protein [Nanoarchaeota archaeon]MBU4351557.1 PAC2 family protein [Nanoarchaeota archaeon]MBU4455879.1 PAC2 family protein [Nanoarchaeota archaeon]
MEIILNKKPKSPTIIEGFPGLGLIATISTEFLIKHLNAKSIGHIWSKELMPIAAVHENKIVQPLEIYFAEKENIVIVHALSDVRGLEWDISETLKKLYTMLKAKEMITIEGILSSSPTNGVFFYASNHSKKKKLESISLTPLKEGIIMGVTAGLVLKPKSMNMTGIFVETQSKLPDSKSAAKVVEVLDNYLDLKVDSKPLLAAAEQFEQKLKALLDQTKKTKDHKKARELDYLG